MTLSSIRAAGTSWRYRGKTGLTSPSNGMERILTRMAISKVYIERSSALWGQICP